MMIDNHKIFERSRQVINDTFVGLCTTVDPDRQPHSRFMGAVLDNGNLSRLFSLTAKGTRKVEHLAQNHAVCWVFATANYEQVVTIQGSAEVQSTTDLPLSAWDALIELTQPYAMNVLSDPRRYSFVSMVTSVQSIEFLDPKMGLASPHIIKL